MDLGVGKKRVRADSNEPSRPRQGRIEARAVVADGHTIGPQGKSPSGSERGAVVPISGQLAYLHTPLSESLHQPDVRRAREGRVAAVVHRRGRRCAPPLSESGHAPAAEAE